MDFIGSMGGINRILLQIAGWFYGGYAGFWSAFSILGFLYKIRSDSQIFKKKEEQELQLVEMPLKQRI